MKIPSETPKISEFQDLAICFRPQSECFISQSTPFFRCMSRYGAANSRLILSQHQALGYSLNAHQKVHLKNSLCCKIVQYRQKQVSFGHQPVSNLSSFDNLQVSAICPLQDLYQSLDKLLRIFQYQSQDFHLPLSLLTPSEPQCYTLSRTQFHRMSPLNCFPLSFPM